MRVASLLLFATLTLIAALHVYWAFGGLWPASTERELIDTVVGAAHMTSMPSTASTLVVAVLIMLAALTALAAGGVIRIIPAWLTRLFAMGIGSVFLARGVAGYFFEVVAWTPVEPFATLNALFYSPLCLLLGALFFLLLFFRPKPNKDTVT